MDSLRIQPSLLKKKKDVIYCKKLKENRFNFFKKSNSQQIEPKKS